MSAYARVHVSQIPEYKSHLIIDRIPNSDLHHFVSKRLLKNTKGYLAMTLRMQSYALHFILQKKKLQSKLHLDCKTTPHCSQVKFRVKKKGATYNQGSFMHIMTVVCDTE